MNFRMAKREDFPVIAEIGRECWELHKKEVPKYLDTEEYLLTEEALETITKYCESEIFVVEENEKVCGFAIVGTAKENKHLYFEDICITEEYRGKGLGWYLSSHIFGLMQALYPELETWSCSIYSFNDPCLNLAKKHGYELIKHDFTFAFPD